MTEILKDEQRVQPKTDTKPATVGKPASPHLRIEFPREVDGQLSQDAEWCQLRIGDQTRRLRFHDYHEIYEIPGLYETLFYDRLQCCSPRVITELLGKEIERSTDEFTDLKILDLGAGNGMVGEALRGAGAESVIGVDIIPEAASATERDRPGLYKDYLVDDLTQPSPDTRIRLEQDKLNCLTSVSALGFGDIPPLAFCEAFNAITTPGWVAFNIKEDFLTRRDDTGFSGLIHRMTDNDVLSILNRRRYQHRLAVNGVPLYYVAVVGRKQQPVPDTWMTGFRQQTSQACA